MSYLDDRIAQLQDQLSQSPQPSIFGIQAPPNPDQMRALLNKLQSQQAVQQAAAPTGGEWGFLHDAGREAFAQIGQSLGSAVSGALTPPPDPSAPPTPQAGISNSIMQAKAAYASMISAGVSPDQAKFNTLKMLSGAGVPGTDDALDKANSELLKNQSTISQTSKDAAQGRAADDEVSNRAFDQKTKTWNDTYSDPNGLFKLQTNGAGETRRVELKPPPSQAAIAAANMDPNSIQFAADTYRTTGKFPGAFARNPAMQQAALKQVAADALANGDTAGSIAARTASLKAGGMALDQVSKQEAFTGSAVNTLDRNLQALTTLGQKLDSTGSPLINRVINQFNQGVSGDPDTAAYIAMLNAVQGEYAKIASNNNGNSPISDSAKADAKEAINKAMSQGGIAAVRQAMMQEAQNRMQAIREAKQGLIGSISGNAPGARQGAAGATTGSNSSDSTQTAPSNGGTPPPTNTQGWALHRDAKGNMAYVSPDGKQVQEVSK
jgi:hypothetical protein